MGDSKILKNHLDIQSEDDINRFNTGFQLGYHEIRQEWSVWASKKKLIADEAIPLMNGLDPQSWEEYKNEEKGFPYEMTHSIKRCLIMAEEEGLVSKAPADWLEWGRNHDLDKPVLKSDEWLKVPDVCMFYLFETAVNEILESTSHPDSMEETSSGEDGRERNEHELQILIKKTYVSLGSPKNNSTVWKALECDTNLVEIDGLKKKYDKEGIIQEMDRKTIFWESRRHIEQKMSRKTFSNYLAKLRNPKKYPE